MFAQFNEFLSMYRVGDYAGIFGLLISIVGFTLTIKTALNSKAAADEAKAAVESIRSDLRRVETVADFATALAIMEEIKSLHRTNTLHLLPDRYSQIKKFLINIRASNPILNGRDQKSVQGAIAQISSLEQSVEKILDGSEVILPSKLNSVLSKQIEVVQTVLVKVKSEIGGRNNEQC
ncbi:hypothetical protein LU640_05035 [Pseudomonas monteilii]|uniref:hypothetical protein n=1 Tax=Pseudomonas monteilii TaxID=76759 RepID=UPI001E46C626|nr:hypothetical protein [Pseudomonas monteilii]MCE1016645.1 hypothetical protein [Pseudomonas monteilii]MCE1033878.1 hypothetical protein [Pseudomonas monteilii]MCE1086018.1 hypothetical protein [Pseudomonas monteilii]